MAVVFEVVGRGCGNAIWSQLAQSEYIGTEIERVGIPVRLATTNGHMGYRLG